MISTLVIGRKKDNGVTAVDFNVFGAVIFGSLSTSKAATFPITEEVKQEDSTVTVVTDEAVIDELEEAGCDLESITLEFVDKLSYESLFTIPVIPILPDDDSPSSGSSSTVILLPELIEEADITCGVEL